MEEDWIVKNIVHYKEKPCGYRMKKVADTKAEFQDIWGDRIVAAVSVGTVIYSALRDDDGKIFGCATPICSHPHSDCISYKNIKETEYPLYFDCPLSILGLLSPTDNETANKWRQMCIEYPARKAFLNNIEDGTPVIYDNSSILYYHNPNTRNYHGERVNTLLEKHKRCYWTNIYGERLALGTVKPYNAVKYTNTNAEALLVQKLEQIDVSDISSGMYELPYFLSLAFTRDWTMTLNLCVKESGEVVFNTDKAIYDRTSLPDKTYKAVTKLEDKIMDYKMELWNKINHSKSKVERE